MEKLHSVITKSPLSQEDKFAMAAPIDQHWVQRARVLTQALIISGTLNIGLLSTFVYFILKEKQAVVSSDRVLSSQEIKKSFTNDQILKTYSEFSFYDLLSALENKDLVEDGYAKRDLALACLTAFHCFPIAKVLGEGVLQKRIAQFRSETDSVELLVFSGLKDDHFEAVSQFAKTEKWPFTAQGLFLKIQKSEAPFDPSLLEAFYITSEFHRVHTLFQKSVPSMEKAALIDILKSGSWEKFREISEKLRTHQCFDEESSRDALISYALEFGSKVAAGALLQYQSEFFMKRLTDLQILAFFDLDLDQKQTLEMVAKELLLSPRSDMVRQKAASYLYSQAQEIMPQPYDHLASLRRFFPEKMAAQVKVLPVAVQVPATPPAPSVLKKAIPKALRVHKIEAGDSLWKIARKYGTSVEAIMKVNQMDSEKLKLGRTLQIPEASLR